jgi:hypothetical protein
MDRLEEGGKRVIPRADITVNALLGGAIHARSEDPRMGRYNLDTGNNRLSGNNSAFGPWGRNFDLVILSYISIIYSESYLSLT